MNIHALPVSAARQHEVRTALEAQDTALTSMLTEAVSVHGSGGLRVVGSLEHTQLAEVADTYLHCVELLLARPGVRHHLAQCLNNGQYDIQALAQTARAWTDEPEAA